MKLATYTIYGLVDPHNHEVRYVGQTRNAAEARLENHLLCAETGVQHPVYDWIRSLAPAQPILIVLQRIEESPQILNAKREHRAHAAEVKWMKRFERFQLLQFVDTKRRAYKRLVNPE
jgi:hypothetical protein